MKYQVSPNKSADGLLQAIRRENLDVYRASAQRLTEDISQEAQIAQDYRGRLLYEILQNADDAMSDSNNSDDRIVFLLTDDELWIGNSGRPLDEADVRGLCGISANRKVVQSGNKRASIGYKGMGFKSVLEVTDRPEAYSTNISLRFGTDDSLRALDELFKDGVVQSCGQGPITRFPWPVQEEPDEWKRMRDVRINTAFRLPFHGNMSPEQKAGLERAILNLPISSLLFLKNLEKIEVDIRTCTTKEGYSWTISREFFDGSSWEAVSGFQESGMYKVNLSSDAGATETFLVAHDGDIRIGENRGGLDSFTWQGVEFTEVSVAVRFGPDEKPMDLLSSWKYFHVFLPTQEPFPFQMILSGAFRTNLSRQEIRVEARATDYNQHLLRAAASLIRDMLIPSLLRSGSTVNEVLHILDRKVEPGTDCQTKAAQAFYRELVGVLNEFKFLSMESSEEISLSECIVPMLVEDKQVGRDFREVMPKEARVAGKLLPATELCGSDTGRVLADLGARILTPKSTAKALASADSERSRLRNRPSGEVKVDPVLDILCRMWHGLDKDAKKELSEAARKERLFPVNVDGAGIIDRVATNDTNCFYPPRSLFGSVPLKNICFLLQDICWGKLLQQSRNKVLKEEMAAWQAIFEIRDFKFPEVMRASVLPFLELGPDEQLLKERESLHSLDHLAAICQLAGRAPKRDAPLPYERLASNRALFNLSRLDVPCRRYGNHEIEWLPAYRAYFGKDWIEERSVECILEAAQDAGAEIPSVYFLVKPEQFSGYLQAFRHLEEVSESDAEQKRTVPDRQEEPEDIGEDEVSLEEDEEASLEADEYSRWLEFLSWLGVNHSLRPVHFHDVEDRASGWLKTKDLKKPEGWIFEKIPKNDWKRFVTDTERSLSELDSDRLEATIPYFYRLHDLEHLLPLLKAATSDETTVVGKALYGHLARNWPTLDRYSKASVALVPRGQYPSMRSPVKAYDDELVETGEDFWVRRLRSAPFCPTGYGPRHASSVWLPTLEVERLFGRKKGSSGTQLIPVLDVDNALISGKARALASTLGIREELTSSNFGAKDAVLLLERIRNLYEPQLSSDDLAASLREAIRPAYRNLMELLSSRGRDPLHEDNDLEVLRDTPLLAHNGENRYKFCRAADMYYVEHRTTRGRISPSEDIWIFAIEALPTARAPLKKYFQMPFLEEDLDWIPELGDVALSDQDLAVFKDQLCELAPFVLARVGADRAEERLVHRDARNLRLLVDCLCPINHMKLRCRLGEGNYILDVIDSDVFVELADNKLGKAFVVWGENPWPPTPQEAEALATSFCEALGAGLFEAFLALIREETPSGRMRLLRRSGAPLEIEEMWAMLFSQDGEELKPGVPGDSQEPPKTTEPFESVEENPEPPPFSPPDRSDDTPIPQMAPLYEPSQLLVEGFPILVKGPGANTDADPSPSTEHPDRGGEGTGKRDSSGGYAYTDPLNELGMWVAMTYELNRLNRAGHETDTIFDISSEDYQDNALIFDVSTPDRIDAAINYSSRFKEAIAKLRTEHGIDIQWPGFDILTLSSEEGESFDRLIELKSSGHTSRFQEMTWNEWKTASNNRLRQCYYLYMVGNLRSDIPNSIPFVRTICDPYGQLSAEVVQGGAPRKKLKLEVALFSEAAHLDLVVRE